MRRLGTRRKKGTPPPKSFEQAFSSIDKLELAVIERSRTVMWRANDVVRWLWPDDMTDKLKAAFPFVRDPDRTIHAHERLNLPLIFPAVQTNLDIKVKSVEIGMLVPTPGMVTPVAERGYPILETLTETYMTHLQFEKVRQVVRWLNENATVGAGRHYCPWLHGLLPEGHAFHEANGQLYREPAATMANIMPLMREAGAIMASALLCGDVDNVPARDLIRVTFSGQRNTEMRFSSSNEDYSSQTFGIL